jgi:hypothetical protein
MESLDMAFLYKHYTWWERFGSFSSKKEEEEVVFVNDSCI